MFRIQTDARHSQRKNAFHTDVVALGLNTHKVVHIENISKLDDPCSQRHEDLGTRRIYQFLKNNDIKLTEHIHDRNASVNKLARETPGVKNSNDKWHAAKATTKEKVTIAKGPKKTWDIVAHSDKPSATRNHFYWSMDNCLGNEEKLKELILNVIPHFQNNHANCHPSSACKQENYAMKVRIIREDVAARMLEKQIRNTTIFKSPADYVNARDTYYVESFNNTCLIYVDKRLRYGIPNYRMRMKLAVLDWNHHVGTMKNISVDSTKRDRNPPKSFDYVERMWQGILKLCKSPSQK